MYFIIWFNLTMLPENKGNLQGAKNA